MFQLSCNHLIEHLKNWSAPQVSSTHPQCGNIYKAKILAFYIHHLTILLKQYSILNKESIHGKLIEDFTLNVHYTYFFK